MTEDKNTAVPPEDNFFVKMENAPSQLPQKKLARSRNNIIIAGVCAGIAKYLKVDTANVRLILIFSLLLGGWSIVAYLLFAILIPSEAKKEETTDEEDEAQRKENFRVLISGLLILVGFYYALQKIGFSGTGRLFVFPNAFMIPIISLLIGFFLLSRKRFSKTIEQTEIDKNYYRSRQRRWILGVCGGLAKYFDIDVSSIRIVFVILTLLTRGLFSSAYIIIAFQTKFENTTLNEI